MIAKKIHFTYALQKTVDEKKLTLRSLEQLSGIPNGRLSEYKNGKRIPGEAIQTKIAAALGYGLADFLALGRSLAEGNKPPVDPVVADYLEKARAVLESSDGEHLKAVIDAMSKQ